jgi:ABC-type oligopeptide transport system ATPase subunit
LKSRRKKFDLFTREYLNVTRKSYESFEELSSKSPDADVFFAGSDQIWNTAHNHGKDPAFYLDFVPSNSVRASYAASFSIPEVPDEYKTFVKTKLDKFDAISVREWTGLNILESLNVKGGIVVLDPVFLLVRERWNELASESTKEKYILIYDQENNPYIKDTAKRLAREHGLKIYAIRSLYPMSYAHHRIIDAGPREFLGLIKNCEFCLTNSFHCTAFSLIFQKEFFTFKRKHEKVNSRMVDLLESVGLKERMYTNYDAVQNTSKIDYEKVHGFLSDKLTASKQYIDGVLSIDKNK